MTQQIQSILSENFIYLPGRTKKIHLPNGEEHEARYVITDLSSIKASHNEVNFSDTIGYPKNSFGENLNDRNYKDDISAQATVADYAKNLKPDKLIQLGTGEGGTPIVNEKGIVVSGNNRIMSLKLAAKQFPEKYEAYKKELFAEMSSFGFEGFVTRSLMIGDSVPLEGSSYHNPLSITIKQPVLVRIDLSLPEELTTEHLAQYNQNSKKGERQVDRAIKQASILRTNEHCRNAILAIVDGYENFTDFYGPNGRMDRKKLVQNFLDCKLIPETQLVSYVENGDFNEVGKDFVETLLSAIILTPDALKVAKSDGVRRLRNTIISALPILITNENLGEGSLKKEISQAVIEQYKMLQRGSFSDYMAEQSMFDEDTKDVKSLYVNALMRTGPNKFKAAIRKYNDAVKSNSGNSLFGNSLSVTEIFKLCIIDQVDPTDKKIIEKFEASTAVALSNIDKSENPQPMVIAHDSVATADESPVVAAADNSEMFINDNWYKLHPEKILGEPYEASGRWGKVTKYKGDISSVDKIDVDVTGVGHPGLAVESLPSINNTKNIAVELKDPAVAAFVTSAIQKADEDAGKKVAYKKRKADTHVDEMAVVTNDLVQLQSFEDVWRTYNEGIEIEELAAYVWYKSDSGKPLSRRWINLIHPGRYTEHLSRTEHYYVDEETLNSWVSSGLVFYYEGKLVPAPIYFSGNMYDRKATLVRDKEEIIAKYGPQVYENQFAGFDIAYRKVYDKRLLIGKDDKALVVLPISKLANSFMIERINEMADGEQFKIKKVTAAANKHYGNPAWKQDDLSSDSHEYTSKRDVFETLSLTNAFVYWMLKYSPKLLKETITYQEIADYYCFGSPIRLTPKDDTPAEARRIQAQKEKLRSTTQAEGERLFKEFLADQLSSTDKIRLESQWNSDYNNYLPIDYLKIPVAFTYTRFYKGSFEKLKDEKREAVATVMTNGSGVLAYDVGVGKTPSAIFTMSAFLDAGYCKRPVLVVPNQVYRQFISEIKNFTPHIPVIEGYNLSPEYLENFKDAQGKIAPVPEGCITVLTYEGLETVGFNASTQSRLQSALYEILNQGGEDERQASGKKGEKAKASFEEKIETLMGKGLAGTMVNIEDLGFDFMCYDEAHKMKKVFTAVKGEVTEAESGKKERGKNPYVINSGTPSSIALKGFMLNYYVQHENNGQNILMLTATPFTNSPLEIFSMLSMVGYEELKNTDLNNIKNFFDTYVRTSTNLVINTRLKPVFKQVILGFNNLISLQSLIRRFINYKTGEDVKVPRPNKIVLPYVSKQVDGVLVKLDEAEKVETYIGMTPQQESWMDEIVDYVETGNLSVGFSEGEDDSDDSEGLNDSTGAELDEGALDKDEKLGVRTIKGLSWSRNLALSPYLYPNSGLGKPTAKKYIETSPKLMYVMNCIKSVKLYQQSKGEPMCGQVIYMDRGVHFFPLIKQYLVEVVGFQEHEVGIISSGMPANGKRSKEYIKNLFNGEIYNEETKMIEDITDDQRIKVMIGSSTIKEGINLQKHGAVLFNLFIDWNPTDIQQLEGRIYRQGNLYNTVRIVNPLMVDSADIFMFQKLSEKTSRLNTIWSTEGKTNVLNTDEFNPEDLKYELIRDPAVIAELQSIEAKETYDSELSGFRRGLDVIEKLKQSIYEINSRFKDLDKIVRDYRDIESTGTKLGDAELMVKKVNDIFKSQTDKEGKQMVYAYERNVNQKYGHESYEDYEERKEAAKNYSKLDKFTKPYWFADFALAVRDLIRAEVNFLRPNKIEGFSLEDTSPLDVYKAHLDEKIKNGDKEKERLASDEYKKILMDAVIADRLEKKITYKSLAENVVDFCKLNYVLSDRKLKKGSATKYTTCPPMDAQGVRLIDQDALAHLDSCIAKEAQTKDLFFDQATGKYEPQRQELHNKIINGLFTEVKCVTKTEPIAIFTGGSPASGKSTYIKKLAPWILTPNVFHLDADAIRAELPEYRGWNANSTHKETQDIVNQLLSEIGTTSCRYDFVYDGTMNKAQKYFTLINRVKEMGYKTFIIFMDIPYGIARERALQRYKSKGRYVPMEVIDDFFRVIPDHNGLTMGQYSLNELKPLVDGYIVIDGISGKIIEKGGEEMPNERAYEDLSHAEQRRIEAGEPFVDQKIEPVITPGPKKIMVKPAPIKAPAAAPAKEPVKAPEKPAAAKPLPVPEKKVVKEKAPGKKAEPVKPVLTEKQIITKQINVLNLARKFSDDSAKAKIEKQIKALNLALKYSAI